MKIVGRVDRFEPDLIEGWVYSPDQPGFRFELEIACADSVLRCVSADLYREDLARAGIGDGRHAFSFRSADLPPSSRTTRS